jgi:hypothetical protein
MRRRSFALGALLVLVAPASASTTKAWQGASEAARLACIKASGLLEANASAPIVFSDRTAQSAVLVRGTYPQKFMKGAAATMLCLYDRRTRKAEAVETKAWSAPV